MRCGVNVSFDSVGRLGRAKEDYLTKLARERQEEAEAATKRAERAAAPVAARPLPSTLKLRAGVGLRVTVPCQPITVTEEDEAAAAERWARTLGRGAR